jgi:peptidylprolyl isomerase
MKRLLILAMMFVAIGLALAACGGGGGANVFAGRDPGVSFSDVCTKSDQKQFSKPEPFIDTSKTYVATIKTDKGDIVLELFSDVPVTTNNFVFLACKGFYDGLTFQRVLQDFMAQGGDPLGTGGGGPGYAIPDEDDDGHTFAEAGAISMAKSVPNTTGSQFFITYSEQKRLDPDFTVFGKVTSGMDVLKQITLRDPDQNPTFTGDKINTITITEQ